MSGSVAEVVRDGRLDIRRDAFRTFDLMGIPTVRHEEWKYTRISSLFNKEFQLNTVQSTQLQPEDIDKLRLPGYQDANQLVFVNGNYAPHLSDIRSAGLTLVSLEEAAAGQFAPLVREHFNHSSKYLKDGINALNTAFIDGGVFMYVEPRKLIKHPVYIYNITDARDAAVLSQPRSLIFVSEGAHIQLVETYITLGESESMTNQVMEIIGCFA